MHRDTLDDSILRKIEEVVYTVETIFELKNTPRIRNQTMGGNYVDNSITYFNTGPYYHHYGPTYRYESTKNDDDDRNFTGLIMVAFSIILGIYQFATDRFSKLYRLGVMEQISNIKNDLFLIQNPNIRPLTAAINNYDNCLRMVIRNSFNLFLLKMIIIIGGIIIGTGIYFVEKYVTWLGCGIVFVTGLFLFWKWLTRNEDASLISLQKHSCEIKQNINLYRNLLHYHL